MGDGRENLNMWQPGQSGNPKGRPVGAVGIKKRIENFLSGEVENKVIEFLHEHGVNMGIKTREDALIAAMYVKGISGDTKAAELLLNRLYGKTKTEIEINTGIDKERQEQISRKMKLVEKEFNE